jgi:hypothetical protein
MKLQEFRNTVEGFESYAAWQRSNELANFKEMSSLQTASNVGQVSQLEYVDLVSPATEYLKLEVADDDILSMPFKIGLLRALDRHIEISQFGLKPKAQQLLEGERLSFAGRSLDLEDSDYMIGSLDPLTFALDLGNVIDRVQTVLRKPHHTSCAAVLSIGEGKPQQIQPTEVDYYLVSVPSKRWIDIKPQVVVDQHGEPSVEYEVPKLPVVPAFYEKGSYRMEPVEFNPDRHPTDKISIPEVVMLESNDQYLSPSKLLLGAMALSFGEKHIDDIENGRF